MCRIIKHVLNLALVLCIFGWLLTFSAFAANNGGSYSYVEGDTVNFTSPVLPKEETAAGTELVTGVLPNGVTYTYSYYDDEQQTYLVFSGKVNGVGTFPVTIRVRGTNGTNEDWDYIFDVAGTTKQETKLSITKSPTSEAVTEGEKATFISTAENYSRLEWQIVSSDGKSSWRGESEIEDKFPGVLYIAFKDAGKEYLVLSNIPMTMNGYYVQTKFWSTDNKETASTEEHSAKITVNQAVLEAPKFSKQPEAAEMSVGSSCTLECTASAKDGTVNYQWYKNSSNSTVGGQKIEGATSSRYVPEQTVGQNFYYCAAWAGKNGRTSEKAYTNVVAVTYEAAATPSPTPAPSSSPQVTSEPAEDEQSDDRDREAARPERRQNNGAGLFAVLLIASAVALAGVATYLIIASRKSKESEAEPAAALPKGWRCPFCGQLNEGRFCQNCGNAKPKGALLYACDKCGWKPADPTHPPRFCPNCGDPFGDEDIVK